MRKKGEDRNTKNEVEVEEITFLNEKGCLVNAQLPADG
jgi:hypothetical protein